MTLTTTPTTRNQLWAQRAFERVGDHQGKAKQDEFLTFAKRFPSLIHTCGLAQAIAFAQARGHAEIVADLAAVLEVEGDAALLAKRSRSEPLGVYLRLSRDALVAAGWIKRYAEALLKDKKGGP